MVNQMVQKEPPPGIYPDPGGYTKKEEKKENENEKK
jgi:hypothetical protein